MLTRVKICGITQLEDARLAVELGAAALGFNFYPRSKRYIGIGDAAKLAAELPPTVLRVGVFVNEDPDVIGRLAGELRLDLVQLSGDEAPEECARLRVPYFKVVHVRSGMAAQEPSARVTLISGASRKTNLSAPSGTISSLIRNLPRSAKD